MFAVIRGMRFFSRSSLFTSHSLLDVLWKELTFWKSDAGERGASERERDKREREKSLIRRKRKEKGKEGNWGNWVSARCRRLFDVFQRSSRNVACKLLFAGSIPTASEMKLEGGMAARRLRSKWYAKSYVSEMRRNSSLCLDRCEAGSEFETTIRAPKRNNNEKQKCKFKRLQTWQEFSTFLGLRMERKRKEWRI